MVVVTLVVVDVVVVSAACLNQVRESGRLGVTPDRRGARRELM